MNIREIRQKQFAEMWVDRGQFGIENLAPRFGKIRVAILIMQKIKPVKVLIAYPDLKIRQSWEDDFTKWNYRPKEVVYTTYVSLHKQVEDKFDLVILDEIHLMSPAQIRASVTLLKANRKVLGLTGTLSKYSQKNLMSNLSLPVVAHYSIEMAIKEGILPDYEINVVKVPLDDRVIKDFNGKKKTEKERMRNLMWLVSKEHKENPSFFLRLRIIDVLQNSIAKRRKTVELIQKFKDERLLVFCGRTEVADSLGIPSYHSKSSEKKMWEDFTTGKINHLAVVKIGNMGVTFTPLNKMIINSFDSNEETMTQRINRAMSLEYDNPDKKAIIYIVCSDEEKEKSWMNNALSMFDKSKIKYI